MSSRPSGTVTFLFTDVAGSTRLWESDRDGMTASLAIHDRILKDVIETNGGYVFATGGDSFSGAFPTAAQALEAAAAAQLALEKQTWSGPRITVRMGIHTGVAEERDGDYFGPAVTRAARIMAVGHGGRVLMSATTAELVRDRLEPPITLSDLSSHPLKDMERPEHLFELRHPDLPVIETPLATDSRGGAHLPDQLTSFVGRSAEISAVAGLLDDSRVVTLAGVGGTGKTRLALEVARTQSQMFTDGAWMAELAPVTEVGLVLQQIADTWGLRPGEGATLIQVLSTYLSNRELLLVIDNCEHVLDSVSKIVAELLGVSSGLTVLTTSRESLGVPGEAVYRVPSMALPANDEEAMQSDAVALFLDRVHKARPDYSPTDDDLGAIVRVCRRLDGIPLGLELAAARLRTLSPVELADRLDDSFRILTGGARTALPRQRTLQATIDWSYELLEPKEALLFRRASTFIGGFSLDAVEAVGAGGDIEEWEILDLVDQLAGKSLLITSLAESRSRFRMLAPIRQYAQERLADEQEAGAVHRAHATHYSELVSKMAPSLRDSKQKEAHETLSPELDNIRAALVELRDHNRIDEFLTMCFDLALFWSQASMQAEALDLLLPILESDPDADPSLLTKGWWVAGALALNLTDPKSVDYAERGLEIAEAAGDEIGIGWTSVMASMAIYGTTRRTDALDYFARGQRLVNENPDHPWWDERWDQIYLGYARAVVGAFPPGERMAGLSQTIAAARAAGDMFTSASAMTSAYFLRDRDDDPEVLGHLEDSVRVFGELGFRHGYGHALIYWGWLTRDRHGDELGESAIAKGSEILSEVGDIPCSVRFSTDLIRHLLETDHIERSIPHLAFAARRAQAAPERYAPRLADLACGAAVAVGDLATAALLLGYRTADTERESTPPLQACQAAVEAGLPGEDVSRLTTEGASLSDAEVLELIGSWSQASATSTQPAD